MNEKDISESYAGFQEGFTGKYKTQFDLFHYLNCVFGLSHPLDAASHEQVYLALEDDHIKNVGQLRFLWECGVHYDEEGFYLYL